MAVDKFIANNYGLATLHFGEGDRKLAEIHQKSANDLGSIILELASRLRDAEDTQDVTQLLVEAISPFGYDRFVYARSPAEDSRVEEYISLTNLEPAWMQHYLSEELYQSDFALEHCLKSSKPLRWITLPELIERGEMTHKNGEVYKAACDWGISNGVTIPLPCFGRYKAGISLVGDPNANHDQQDQLFQAEEKTLSTIVQIFHAAVNMGTIARGFFNLSKREIEVLKWLSNGLKTKEIAKKLQTSVHTVEKQSKSARERLGAASSTEAVAKAAILGIIN